MMLEAQPASLRQRLSGTALSNFFERRLGLTLSGVALLLLAIVSWLLARITGSRATFLFAYGVVLVLISARLLATRRPAITAYRSNVPSRVREGQEVRIVVVLEASRRMSNVIIQDELDPLLGVTARMAVPQLRPGHRLEHSYAFRPLIRGVFQVGPLEASWSDPFGLTRRRLVLSKTSPMIVHPSTELVHDRVISRAWEDPPIRPPVSKPWPTGFEFYGMRDYVPGDDPRRIIWRATARMVDPVTGTGRYLVREAEQGITDRVSLILDTDRRHHSPGARSETFESAVRTVGSLGARHLQDGFAVTVEANSARLADSLRTRGARIPLLDVLARVERERVQLTAALDRVLMNLRRDTHLVLVSPHVDDAAARRLGLLIQKGFSLLVALIVWEESDPASMHRVASLGCNVVEITGRAALGTVFQRVVEAGARKQ